MGAVLAQGAAQFDRFIELPANGIIVVSSEQGVPLRRLLEAQLAGFDKQLDVSGPEVILDAAPALSFATLINELAVSAARYGALSVSAGKVSLHWTVDEKSDPSTLMFLWRKQEDGVLFRERVLVSIGPTSKRWCATSENPELTTRRAD